jgi:hypothetical protein
VDYYGFVGTPDTTFITSLYNWRGNAYSAQVNFNVADLIQTDEEFFPEAPFTNYALEHALIAGDQQFAFILALTPDMEAYYKVVFTYNPGNNRLVERLIIEVCGDNDESEILDFKDLSELIQPDGRVSLNWTVMFSSDPTDIVVDTGGRYGYGYQPGYDNFDMFDTSFLFTEIKSTTYTGTTIPMPVAGGIGDMAVHYPAGSSIEVFSTGVRGVGTFPAFQPGDTISLNGAGWPM